MRIIKKIYLTPIYKKEEKIFYKLAKKTSSWLHPDLATALAVLSALGTFLLLVFSPAKEAYLYSCILIFWHWIFDSLDGKLAKVRKLHRPAGALIDKIADTASSIFFVSGLFSRVFPPAILISSIIMLIINIVRVLLWHYKKIDIKAGGTEGRILFVIFCLLLFFTS